MPSFLASPADTAAFDENTTEDAVSDLPKAANIGWWCTGCGVGIDALGSPIGAATIEPPLMMHSGLPPKNAGDHGTRSASLRFSTEPVSFETPRAIAGLMGYLVMERLTRKLSLLPLSCGSEPRCFFILSAVCQVRIMTSPSRPMACEPEDILESAPRSR